MARKSSAIGWVIGAVIIILVGWLIWMWVNDNGAIDDVTDTDNTQQEQQEQTPEEEISQLEQITTNPENYLEQTVTVNGEVQDAISNRVFSISDDPINEEVLVVTRSALTDQQVAEIESLLQDNANVEVTGDFRQFVVADIESEFDVDFDSEVETEFENQHVIIADNLTFTDSGQDFNFLDNSDTGNTNDQ